MKPQTASKLILGTATAALASLLCFTAGVAHERGRVPGSSPTDLEHELLCTVDAFPTFKVDGAIAIDFDAETSTWAVVTETMQYRYVQQPGEACGMRSGRR